MKNTNNKVLNEYVIFNKNSIFFKIQQQNIRLFNLLVYLILHKLYRSL